MKKYLVAFCFIPFFLFSNINHSASAIFQTSYFIENRGQFDKELNTKDKIYYSTQMEFGRLMFHKGGLTIKQYKEKKATKDKLEKSFSPKKMDTQLISFEWLGANPNCEIIPSGKSKHYFTFGREPHISYGYKELRYVNLYPNIDLVYTLEDNQKYHYSIILRKGANVDNIKLKINGATTRLNAAKNELKIENVFNPLKEYGLKALALHDAASHIPVNYTLQDNILGFNLNQKIVSQDIEIDPWVSSFQKPFGNPLNVYRGYDVDYDNEGNMLVFGGSSNPIQENLVAKYDTVGNLLWTFDCSWIFPFGGNAFGNFIVDKRDNKIYLNQGINTSRGIVAMRFKKTGIYDSFMTSYCELMNESWDMQFNTFTNELIVFGGGTWSGVTAARLPFNDDTLITTNFTNNSGGYQDIVSSCVDEAGYIYTLIASNPNVAVNNRIFKINSAINGNIWNVYAGNSAFIELSNKEVYYLGLIGQSNAFNALSVNNKYVYYYNGSLLKAFNKTTGAPVGSESILPNFITRKQGGIESDDCNNVYIGGNNGNVLVYNFNGTSFSFVREYKYNGYAGKAVYDMKLDRSKNKLFISGETFVAMENINCDSNDFNVEVQTNCTSTIFAEILNPFPGATYDYIWIDTSNNSIVGQKLNTTQIKDTLTFNAGKAVKLNVYRKSATRPL